MKRYEAYKPTGLEWYPAIPQGWEWRYLFQVAHEQTIKKPAGEMYPIMTLSYGEIKRKKNTEAGLLPSNYDSYQMLYKGNIVLRLIDLQNDHTSLRTGLVKETGIITSAYTCIMPTGNPAYAQYLLHSYDTKKVFYGYGGGVRQSIGFKDIRHLQVSVPPREEQDQIVRYLDWQVSKINRLIAAKRRQIQLIDEHSRSLVCHHIMVSTKEACCYKESGINWCSSIPAHWDILYISQVTTERLEKNTGLVEKNLLSLSYGRIVQKDINTTEGLLPASFEGYQIVNPDNIILRLTDLQNDHKSLRVGLSHQRGIITSAYVCLCARDSILPEYLYMQLHSADLCKVFYGMGGGVRQSIGYKDIKKLLIAVPPIEEQKKIVESIKNCLKPYDKVIESLEAEINSLFDLRTRLISDVVTGQVDVRGIEVPEYEYVAEAIESDENNAEVLEENEEAD